MHLALAWRHVLFYFCAVEVKEALCKLSKGAECTKIALIGVYVLTDQARYCPHNNIILIMPILHYISVV